MDQPYEEKCVNKPWFHWLGFELMLLLFPKPSCRVGIERLLCQSLSPTFSLLGFGSWVRDGAWSPLTQNRRFLFHGMTFLSLQWYISSLHIWDLGKESPNLLRLTIHMILYFTENHRSRAASSTKRTPTRSHIIVKNIANIAMGLMGNYIPYSRSLQIPRIANFNFFTLCRNCELYFRKEEKQNLDSYQIGEFSFEKYKKYRKRQNGESKKIQFTILSVYS
jgi:hypothetical protein